MTWRVRRALPACSTPLFGNDGPLDVDDNDVADADALAFSLSITGGDGTDSGLIDVISGNAILLRVNVDGDIEGYLANDTGTVAFIIDLDPATGEISLEQDRAITHNDPADPVESGLSAATMAANLIILTATVTDGDGDTAAATAEIGDAFAFEDDGPDAFDEPQQDVPEGQTISGAFDFDPGADGATVTHINDILLVFDAVTGWSQWIMVDEGQIRAMADGSYEFQANADWLACNQRNLHRHRWRWRSGYRQLGIQYHRRQFSDCWGQHCPGR